MATDAATFTDLAKPEECISVNSETTSLTSWLDVDLDEDMDSSSTFSGDADIDLFSTDTENPDNEFAIPEEEPLIKSSSLIRLNLRKRCSSRFPLNH